MKILLAEDSRTNQMLIRAYAEEAGHEVVVVDDGQKAVDYFKTERPDLILMDVTMPVKDGIDATKDIRKITNKNSGWVPIIFLSGMDDSSDIAKGIDAGGDDYLTKPIDAVVLVAKLRAMQRISEMQAQLNKANNTLKMMAIKDALTGLYNRRYFDEMLIKELKRSMRTETSLSLILCDIDYFKMYNDHYGHQAGDDCLVKVAQALQKECQRPGDVAARYGGEEFVFILPETGLQGAGIVAESIVASVKALSIPHQESSVSDSVTLSCGVASVQPKKTDDLIELAHNLIKLADENLYKAKEQGRDRVVSG